VAQGRAVELLHLRVCLKSVSESLSGGPPGYPTSAPTNQGLAQEAGTALFWRIVQQGGDNLIYLLRLIILARLLTPDDFGLVAIAMAGFVPLLIITDLGMIPALVQRADATEQEYNTAWTMGMLRAAVVCGAILLTAPMIAAIFAEPRATNLIRALSVLPILEAAVSIKIAELIRRLRFRLLAIAKLSQALANTFISIALVPSLGVWALVAGTLAGPAAYVAVSYILAPHRPRLVYDSNAARSLVRYGRWILVTGLMSISAAVALRIVLSRQLGAAGLGLYSLGAKLAFLPHDVAGDVIGGVTFPIYARLQSNVHQAAKAFRTILTAMLMALAPLFSLMLVLAPSAVTHVLGPRWDGTAPLIRILAVAGLLRVIGDATVPVLKGLGRPYKFAVVEGVQTVILISCAWGLIGSFGLIGAGYAWCPAAAGSLVVSIIFLRQNLHDPFAGLARPLVAIAAACATGGVIAIVIDHNWPGVLGVVIAGVTAAGSMLAVLWVATRVFALDVRSDFARAFPKAAAVLPGFGR
jgi:lipopolysaccharide exporter